MSTLIEIYSVLKTHFIVRIGFCTTLCVLSLDRQVEREREREREREICMFFLNFVIFFNSESSSTYFKDSCISLQNKIDRRVVLHYKRHLRRWRASKKRFGFLKEERKCSERLNKWTFTTCK